MLETDDLVAVRNADLGFGGKIRNGRLIAMLGCKYDLFIDLNKETTALIKFVLQHTQASCIVGMKKEGGVADIVIDEVTEPFGLVNKLTVDYGDKQILTWTDLSVQEWPWLLHSTNSNE